MSDHELMNLLRLLVLLLFIGSGVAAASRYRSPVALWLRRGSVVLFVIAALYALLLVVLWIAAL